METDGLGSVGCLCMNLHNIHTKKKKKKPTFHVSLIHMYFDRHY